MVLCIQWTSRLVVKCLWLKLNENYLHRYGKRFLYVGDRDFIRPKVIYDNIF